MKPDVRIVVPRTISLEELENAKLSDGTLRNVCEWKLVFSGKDGKRHEVRTKCSAILLRFTISELSEMADVQRVTVQQLDNGS